MKNVTLLRIVSKIHTLKGDVTIRQIPWQEARGFYDVWEIRDACGRYLLKKNVSDTELAVYHAFADSSDAFAHLYGCTTYRHKTYMLTEFVDGHDLMRANRNDLIRVLDAMIRMQNAVWSNDRTIGNSVSDAYASCLKRRDYLSEQDLLDAFSVFAKLYQTTPKTICHSDFLPFNLIVAKDRVVFIDWECGGVLPYPVMLARLLAHVSMHGETPFYMSDKDSKFALFYYYEHLIKRKGIRYEDYKKTMNAFLFYERLEWVYVYRKYKKKPDERFDYALRTAKEAAAMVLKDK